MMNAIFIHGWGYDPRIWDSLVNELPDITPHFIDLGFTGNKTTIPKMKTPPIIIGHSLGVIWALKHLKQPFHALVSISGFDCFTNYIPIADMKKMKMHLTQNPAVQLTGFWQACGGQKFTNPDRMNIDRLQEGLDWLITWDETARLKNLNCPILALAGENDVITPLSMQKDIFSCYDLKMKDGGDHLLPCSVSSWCGAQIKDFLKNG